MIKRLLVNTGSNVAVMVVKLVITFVMTPVFVTNLGRHDYGVWEMVVAITGYMGLLDLGMRPAISRFAAKYAAEGDQRQLALTYSSTFAFMGLTGGLLLAVFLLWAWQWPGALAGGAREIWQYSVFLVMIGLQLAFSFPGYVAESYLEGFQKYYLKNLILLINSVVSAVIVYVFITPANALVLVVTVSTLFFAIKNLIYVYLLARQDMGGIRFRRTSVSLAKLREIAQFGLKSFVQGVSTRIETGSDTIVIGYFLGPAMVPFYSIPANLVNHARMLGWTLTHAFMPLFSDLQARGDQHRARDIYVNASRYVVGILLPLAVGIALLGADFIGIWIGPEYKEKSVAIIALLVVFMLTPLLDPFNSRYLTAIGEHGIYARRAPIAALLNIAVTVILVQEMGIVGAAIGSVVPVLLFFPGYLRRACRHLGISALDYLRASVLPAMGPSVVMAVAVLIFKHNLEIDSYLRLASVVTLGAFLYLGCFYWFALSGRERSMLRQWRPVTRTGGGA